MTDKGLIHILIVFKGVVFQTSLQILPKLINVIDRCVSSFCLNAIALVFCDLFLFVSQFIKCLGIHITPFVVGVRPTEMVSILDAAIIGSVIAAVSPAVVVPRMIKLIEDGYGTDKSNPF